MPNPGHLTRREIGMAKPWPLPEDSNTDKSAFMEHRGKNQGGKAPERGGMSDTSLANALDVSVSKAHEMIEGVTEHRSTDLDLED